MALAVKAMIGIVTPRGAQLACGRVAIHDRHLHVHQDQIERFGRPRGPTACWPFSASFDLRSGPAQHQLDQLAVGVAVVDDQQRDG